MKIRVLTAVMLVIAMMFTLCAAGCAGKTETKVEKQTESKSQVENKAPAKSNAAFQEAEAKLLDSLKPLPEKGKRYKLAALEITLANPFWVTMKQGYEEAAKEYGVDIDVLAAPKEDDINSQLDTLKALVVKGYDAIAISAITPFNLISGVAEANKKGIPVVAVGTSIDEKAAAEQGAKVEAFITSDFAEQGRLGARFIVEKVKSGKVAIIEGLAGAAQGEARKNGAKEVFESSPGIQLVSVQPGDWDRQKAYDLTVNLLQAHPDLKGIFCANDVMALGAVEALKAKGKKQQVTVVGVDFIDEARESIAKGELDGTVAMSPYLFGKGGVILMLKVLQGHQITEDIYWTPLALVNKSNVHTFEGWH
ncbi:substrate-binding domain-containing protein [Syntrophothermus lipocalidus]|uniref:Periplasmic binding protein/LacI transcriptional regulator n=1 Tax=Syntrophothermus lipocalidus (strain DSM 12680 / TGB-C1) TaxID=643648 RepID=D7CJZ2_SYNLT|nr:substrate-binding domain-containing protein [Syntrophothermus lipocalidus]ADI01106.1 periplasmic binding protein/LacI transcriptional regulator [Syntrophothermus lipocalidus DSM 12680]